MLNRRVFLSAAPLAFATALPSQQQPRSPAGTSRGPELLRQPDAVRAQVRNATAMISLDRSGERWTAPGLELTITNPAAHLDVALHAPATPVHRVHLRWHGARAADTLVMGDAWERSYGDLAWMPLQPERVLPWYFLAWHAGRADGAGVTTGAAALAFWQVDAEGVSLWLDVRNGGNGVVLGERTLLLASIVQISPQPSGWTSAKALCRAMVAGTTVARTRGEHRLDVLYGSNDWYYAYGKNTADGIRRDADLMRELAPSGKARPLCIIDDGYRDATRFPSLPRLAEDIRAKGCVPGIWIRPLQAAKGKPEHWMLPAAHWSDRTTAMVYDPTVPEGRQAALDVVREARGYGFDFLKHDFTTYELLGGWGNHFGASPTRDGWNFYDISKTNAEILRGVYQDIRSTAGDDSILLGCNTVGHLSVGIFDASRTGDDTSGRDWERTRRMGVNTLAFRLPQDRVFFRTDADCVPFTPQVPWQQTEAWLHAVAGSGSMLLVSADPRSTDTRAKAAIRQAFATVAEQPQTEPLDWMESRTPTRWRTHGQAVSYDWLDDDGASPFSI